MRGMTQSRVRRLIAATVTAAALTVSGCAVPGQEADPGVAAQYDARTLTNAQVNDVYQAWVVDTEGAEVPTQRRSIITIELMAPQLVVAAEEAGYPISDDQALTYAIQWIRFAGIEEGEPSQQLVETVRAIFALAVLAVVEPELETLRQIAQDVEDNAVFSPRSGEFSTETFLTSVTSALDYAASQNLGPFFFTAFVNVNGLVEPASPWIDRG